MKTNKTEMRSYIFYHLDGIALIPTILCLGKQNMLNEFSKKKISLSYLTKKYNANEGYLNVALRLLCCQGWLTQSFDNGDVFFVKNKSIFIAYNVIYSELSAEKTYRFLYLIDACNKRC